MQTKTALDKFLEMIFFTKRIKEVPEVEGYL